MEMDLCIRGGTVYDGSGAEPRREDVWIDGGKIVAHEDGMTARRVIDAAGLTVCPGFVDIHRHCDIKPFLDGSFGDAELAQGITTVVTGNCGITMTPLNPARAKETHDYQEPVLGRPYDGGIYAYPDYLRALDDRKLPVNFASMIGTGSVNIAIKGFEDRPFTPEELARARGLIDEALREGAAGVSIGIMYIPECYCSTDEFAQMLRPVGEHGAVVTAHIRGESNSLVESVREVIEIGRRAGCAVEISHFKSVGLKNWKRDIHTAIGLIEEARARGQDVTCDFYPYDGGSTTLSTMLPPSFVRGDMAGALRRLGTPEGVAEFRAASAVDFEDWDNLAVTLGWDRILVSAVGNEHNRKYLGKSVTENAAAYGFEDAAGFAAHLMHDEDGKVAIINMSMCQDDIDAVARLPYSNIISDAIYAETDTPHPRMFGTFPKVLREYVRERGLLTMSEAIRKMTASPAARMKIPQRGLIRPGCWADVNVFDPAVFRDNATFTDSARKSTGLSYCLVNGEIAVQNDVRSEENHGVSLRIRR